MEFFAEIKNKNLNINGLKNKLSIAQLPALCQSIDSVLQDNVDHGRIYCVWGEFNIKREELMDGIRFTLPNCPNAVAWTITYNELSSEVVIHCTINKKQHDEVFIDSLEQFVADWKIN